MEQAGLNKITLYENKDIVYHYPDTSNPYEIDSISNSGDIITFDLCTEMPQLNFKSSPAENNELFQLYNLIITLDGLQQSILDKIQTISESIYGWVPYLEFMNATKQVIPVPFWTNKVNDLNTSTSHHFVLNLSNRIATEIIPMNYV